MLICTLEIVYMNINLSKKSLIFIEHNKTTILIVFDFKLKQLLSF